MASFSSCDSSHVKCCYGQSLGGKEGRESGSLPSTNRALKVGRSPVKVRLPHFSFTDQEFFQGLNVQSSHQPILQVMKQELRSVRTSPRSPTTKALQW